jgi:hypothetical protein
MTNTYNTLNPLGSVAVKDLFDNTSNFDEAMNSASPSFYDRFKKRRETWAGMEKMVADFLEAMGFEATHLQYVDGVPLTVLRPTQLVDRAPSVYKVKAPATFPVELTGTWATDQLLLVDVGDAALRASLAASDGATLVGSTRLDASVTTVETRLDEAETATDHSQSILTTLAEIVAAFPDGATMRIKDGVYELASPLTVDYSTNNSQGQATSFPGFLSKRYDIRGQSQGNTIFVCPPADFSIKLLGSYPANQNVSGFDYIGNMTITDPVRNLPNTTNAGGKGLYVQMKAFTKIEKVFGQNLALGMELDGVLTSSVEDVNFIGCYQGILTRNTNAFSGPNAMRWARVRVSNTTSNGIVSDVGSAAHFDNLVVESCGTHATISCGMVLTAQADQIGGNVVMTAPYFELNKGAADLYIDNLGSLPMVVTINGGIFARAGSEYTNFCIKAHSSGGGQVTVLLNGVTFLSAAGYPADPSRPFWSADANCRIIADEFCTFNETVSLPTVGRRFARGRALIVDASTSILSGDPTGLTITRPSTGVITVTSTGTFGVDSLGYNVTANGCDSTPTGVGTVRTVVFQPINASQFALNCYNSAGALANGPVSMTITSVRGGV